MRKKIFSLLLLCSFSSYAQIKDSVEAKAIAKRVLQFQEDKADSVLAYSILLENFSKKENYKQGISDAIRFKGIYFEFAGKYDSAIQYYLKNLEYARKNLPPQKALALYTDLMSVYKLTKQYNVAKHYGLMMKAEARLLKDSARLSSALMNLGVLYRNLKQHDSAILNYREALDVKEKIGDSAGLANLRINLSAYYDAEKMYKEAYETIFPNIAYHQRLNDSANLFYDYSNMASALIGLKNFDGALAYAQKAKSLVESSSNSKLAEVYEIFAGLYYAKGNFKEAYSYQEKSIALERELLNEAIGKQMAEAREKFETEKKEQQNLLLSAQLDKNRLQKRNTTLIAIAAILLAAVIGWGYRNKQKANVLLARQKQEIEDKTEMLQQQAAQIAKLQTQMNPHFIFNAINSVQRFVLQENKTKALDYLNDFAKLMRLTLNNSDKELITLQEEKQFLQYYLQFELLRYNDQFVYEIIIEKKLDETAVSIPPMIVQPYIENAIKHGLQAKEKGGKLLIEFTHVTLNKEERLQISIADNGIGRSVAAILKNETIQLHHSKAMDITASRIQAINKKYLNIDEATVSIIDLQTDNLPAGTQVIIFLPFIENF